MLYTTKTKKKDRSESIMDSITKRKRNQGTDRFIHYVLLGMAVTS